MYFSWIVDCRLTNDSPFERVNPVHFTRETSNFMVMSTKTSICNQYRNKLIFLHFFFIFARSVPFKWAHFFNMCIFQKWSTSTFNVLILQFLGQMMTQKCYRLFVICFRTGVRILLFFLFRLDWFGFILAFWWSSSKLKYFLQVWLVSYKYERILKSKMIRHLIMFILCNDWHQARRDQPTNQPHWP